MRFLLKLTAAAVLAAALTGQALANEKIKIGVTPGAHEEVMEQVVKVAAEKGLDIEIISFSDYVIPNQALDDGDLQANSFQHKPYLDNQIKDRGYDLSVVGYNILTPMGIYSDKIKDLSELKDGAEVGIPNDPTNGGRALLVLQSEGLIKVDPAAGLSVSPLDVIENPKNIKFVELDAAQLPRSLADLDASAINTNYALEAGLNPIKDSIAIEGNDSPYANVIVTRTQDKDAPWVKTLVESYHDDSIREFIETKYEGSVLPVFKISE
ncbi:MULTISPECIES: MetQ/NlpA family ABC transporter substrate-binding protein [Thalassospira]|uniref:MetQ/NlpA family ABC transporter substrate-binding protein n=1 Tax=Thalassospira TaxID=168934 RepID=UPI000AC141E3|nr:MULTISPECIES: MetQ/NlpA family ABC transporter substrate-binding protein [Thalassospira]MBO9508292.1 MetQ/NlpA family ABC transporter substrate-binding protein [Thalassospira sp. A3_1]MCK2166093.1 MetQ/NlpA family ABC transporter substrate-binding protein [Thalassospira xiamenensis]WOI09822.1 MetQ/NlpA family ABC transporter substrate-binding protein [Thalassospira lucentensis]